MRILEILTLATLVLTYLGFFVPEGKRPRWMAFLPSLIVLLVLAHLVLEGYRWQMVPAYVLTTLTFLATVRGLMPGFEPRAKSPSTSELTVMPIRQRSGAPGIPTLATRCYTAGLSNRRMTSPP